MKYFIVEPFDEQEKELVQLVESGETNTATDNDDELKRAKTATKNYLEKNKNINIRLTTTDILKLKSKAAQAGIPYQTLVSSILHQYVNDKIKGSL